MDIPKTSWLLSILLASLGNCFASAVSPSPPAPPSSPECYIPFDDENYLVYIYCTWDPRQEPQIPTNYSLHWRPGNSEEGHVITGTSLNGYIHREQFLDLGKLHVWVQAKNQHGSAKSEEAVINTEDIIKPPPPIVKSDDEEISWSSNCATQGFSLGHCNVRIRNEADQVWLEEESGFYGSYSLDSVQPCTFYEFQVRCACSKGLKSEWSEIHRINGTETIPIGELDVWRDCGIPPASYDCVLTWKRLTMSQACGLILGYEVRKSYKNGSMVLGNVSTAEPRGQLVCDKMQCHFASSLKDVSSVSISAYNAHGATMSSYLAMSAPGITVRKEQKEQAFHLTMNEQNLTVSWDLSSSLADNLKEYVVQYKQAGCPPGQAFDWVKVDKNQTTATFTGQFKKYTPYQVSLLTVSHSNEVHLFLSNIGYSCQRTPSKVLSFEAISIADTHVTLIWEPVPLYKQEGLILYYQIGGDGQKVYNVSASPWHENETFRLPHLSPGQDYEVWIRAVTAGGPGEKVTMRFKTKHREYFDVAVLSVLICVLVLCVLFLFSACPRQKKLCPLEPFYCDKVPDPRNSHIFREMTHQMNDSMAWICIPVYEQQPKISVLEVLEKQSWASKSSLGKTSDADKLTRPVVGEGSSEMDCQDDQKEDAVTEECECHRTDHKYGRMAYSKMVDSDEEMNGEEDKMDCWSSSEEEQFPSGYEKHFMPTALEILEVS